MMNSTHLASPSADSPSADSPLRKVALLLASLDADAAEQLLSQMDAASARNARHAMAQLGPIDAAEQAEVIAEFLGDMDERPSPVVADSAAVELDASLARKLAAGSTLSATSEDASGHGRLSDPPPTEHDRPWRRVHAASAQDLARCLAGESPQFIAVVLAQLTTAQAADTLRSLPADAQSDLLGRIARVATPPVELLAEIGRWLDQRLSQIDGASATREFVPSDKPRAGAWASARDTLGAAERLAYDTTSRTVASLERSARHDRMPEPPNANPTRESDDARSTSPAAHDHLGRTSTDVRPDRVTSFAELIDLGDVRLAAVLRQAAPLEVVLAVAGAAPDVASRWLDRLPDEDRRHMQRTLSQLGPWRLSDAAAAQQRLVELANLPDAAPVPLHVPVPLHAPRQAHAPARPTVANPVRVRRVTPFPSVARD